MNKHLLISSFALAATLGTTTSCGTNHTAGGGTPTCMNVAPCGGNLTGSWKMVNVCFDQPTPPSDVTDFCPTAKLNVSNPAVTGNVAYNADKTFTQTATVTATLTLTLPGSCLTGQNAVTCTQIESSSNQGVMDPSQLVTCVMTADNGCQCSSALQDTSQATGTYTVDTSHLMQVGSDGSTDDEDFCVQGNNLYLLAPQSMTMTMPMAGDISLSLVLQRQ
jgi:hypothetical protein